LALTLDGSIGRTEVSW